MADDRSVLLDGSDGNRLDAWREQLAIALQGQYGTAKPWRTLSEQARDGWRADAANIMASLPDAPLAPVARCPLCHSSTGHWHGCGYGLNEGYGVTDGGV